MSPTAPSITISIVSYNTREDLLACLASIYSAPPNREFNVIVADNGSTDGSIEAVAARFPSVCIIETGENLGYGRANNRALLGAPDVYYAILNSDLQLQPGSLDICCDYLDRHPEAGVVGGALLNPDGTPQMNWAAGELTHSAVLYEQLFLAQAFPRSSIFGRYFNTDWRRGDTRALPQVCGAFMVARAEIFNKLGGFDPTYFMYAEDTDLCKRIRLAGSSCVYLHTAPAIHGHGKSSANVAIRPRMVLEHNISRIYYLRKYRGSGEAMIAKIYMMIGSNLRIALWTTAGRLLRRPELVRKGRDYREVLTKTFAIPLRY